MLFDDEEVSGRRLFRRWRSAHGRESVTLKAQLRNRKNTQTAIKAASITLIVIVGVAAVLGGWRGAVWLRRVVFANGGVFTVANLDIRSDGDMLTPAHIMEYTGLHSGMSMFSVNIGQVRRDFLKAVPNIREAVICRKLPDTIEVRVQERTPIARIGQRGYLAVDSEGHVFGLRVNRPNLPVIAGYNGPMLRPGDTAKGLARDAVSVLDAWDNSPVGREAPLLGIDVAGGFSGMEDSLRLYLGGETVVDLWWRREKRGTLPDEDLRNRLLFLAACLREARREGKPVKTINLTLERYTNNCPATPRWN